MSQEVFECPPSQIETGPHRPFRNLSYPTFDSELTTLLREDLLFFLRATSFLTS